MHFFPTFTRIDFSRFCFNLFFSLAAGRILSGPDHFLHHFLTHPNKRILIIKFLVAGKKGDPETSRDGLKRGISREKEFRIWPNPQSLAFVLQSLYN
jgi:hypothetical protein